MKFAVFLLLVIFTASCSAQSAENTQKNKDESPQTAAQTKQVVLVELFTSEG